MRVFATSCLVLGLLAGIAAGQTNNGIADVYISKVKPEKRADFDAIARKIADANRKAKGDNWIAYSVEYGDQNTVIMSSVRENFAAIDTGMQKFEAAMKEGFGPMFMKLFQDMNNTVVSTRSEIRARRLDLSRNIPDQDGIYKLVGQARFIRQNVVRIRPGHLQDYEASLKDLKMASEKEGNGRTIFVSQVIAGDRGGTLYFSSYGKNMADFEPPTRPLREVLGADAYERYQKAFAEGVITSEAMISRILPDMSNPPEQIANIDPAFWRPARKMPAPAAKPPAKSGD